MLTAIIHAPTIGEVDTISAKAINSAEHGAQCLEWRLDGLETIDFDALKQLREKYTLPLIFTLRSKSEGGSYNGGEELRLKTLKQLASLRPDYIDIEHHVHNSFLESIKTTYPDIKIIRSSHNFKNTPKNLNSALALIKHPLCDIYKIITTAQSSLDCLRVLSFVKEHANKTPIVCHAMGANGAPSRVLGCVFGNKFTYASVNNEKLEASLGVLNLITLSKLYRVKSLNHDSSIYALIGSPISYSIGHVFHNHGFRQQNKNSVYVKFDVKKNEVKTFLDYAKNLNIKGISITMPLKETVLPFVENNDSDIGAVNTLLNTNNRWQVINTDGIAALNCLEGANPLKGKSVLIIGAGGAAKAIAHEAHMRGLAISIINRSIDKAKALATPINANAYALADHKWSKHKYDAIINTLPPTVTQTMAWEDILKDTSIDKTIVMDISYKPRVGRLLLAAKKLGLSTVTGRAMFIGQAQLQQKFWQA